MLTISQVVMSSLERNAAELRREQFLRWIASVRSKIGVFSEEQASKAFDDFFEEAAQAGIDTDQRLFEYGAARMLMPEINGLQYLKTLDVVFSDQPADLRMAALMDIRKNDNG